MRRKEIHVEIVEADEFKRRTKDDLLDSCQGYTGLLSTQISPPAVYTRMDHQKRPCNAEHTEPNANETNISDVTKAVPKNHLKTLQP